jgi:hypothetical protein
MTNIDPAPCPPPTEPQADAGILKPDAAPPSPGLPPRHGFPDHVSDAQLEQLAQFACTAVPEIGIPLQRGRWTYSEVERIASHAIVSGVTRHQLPSLLDSQQDAVCIAATRRLYHLLANAPRSPSGANALVQRLTSGTWPEGLP